VDDRRNLLYLTDFFDGKLDQYRLSIQTDGTIQLKLQFTVGTFGHGPGEFSFPQYLTVDEVSGLVYVGDMGNRRIQALDPQGNFVAEFSPPVDEWQVLGLAIGANMADTSYPTDTAYPTDTKNPGDQTIYAADALNRVIWAFGPDGQFQRKIEVH
jgi:DNA-binding beta-propeller fold protein YncE